MLTRLVLFSLRYRGVVVALACLLVGYGLYVAHHAKLDVFPDFVPPEVVVQTEAPGLTPEQVESLVTRPVESAINGLGGLEALRSESIQGLSAVTAVFKEGTDIFAARQSLGERLVEAAGELPAGVRAPKMEPLTSSTMDLLKIGLVSDKQSPMELRTFADWTLKPRLLAVPGVAKCSVYGGDVREVQVQVVPSLLQAFDVSVQDVVAAARAAVGVRGAGFIETPNQRIVVQAETPSLTPAQLGEVVVTAQGGQSVRLRDVARIAEGAAPKVGDAVIQGRPGVLLTMSSQYGANTMEVTAALEAALDEMAPVFKAQGIQYHPGLHRPASFISAALRNVRHSLLLGGILVAAVLFLFLFNVRTAFVSITAIPLSLLAAVIVLDRFGFTLNTMTLGGLAIAIGEVVDDAIIDVENIYRRLRENHQLAAPLPLLQVVLEASVEVRSAVVYATFVVALVFVPVLTMSGLQGKFFAPLGWAYIIAIVASLLVALTVTPALSLILFRRGAPRAHDPWFQRALKGAYRRALDRLTSYPRLLATLVAVLCVFVVAALPFFGEEFLPEFREGHYVLEVSAAPGTSLGEMRRLGERLSAALLSIPHVKTAELQIGRAELGEDTWGPEVSEFHVNLDDGLSAEEQSRAEEQIRETLGQFPGLTTEVTTFLGDRIGESISGEKAAVVINLFGEDLDRLDESARRVADAIRKLPGAAEVLVKSPPKAPRLVVRPRPDRLLQLGYRPMDVLDAVQVSYQGETVGQSYAGNAVSDVAVMLEPAARQNPEQVGELMVQNTQGTRVALSQLADVYQDTGRSSISREGARRRQTVTCNPEGTDPSTFVAAARQQVAAAGLPDDVYPEFGGEAEVQRTARNQLLIH